MVAAVVILFFVLLSVTLFLEIRYGILNPFPYKRIKYSALYDSNFWKTFVASNKEQGFIVRSQPKTPLTDYVIVYSVYSKEHVSNVLAFLESGELWKNWHCRVYIHDQCPEWIDLLKTKKNVQLYIVNDSVASSKNSAGDFWRLLPLCEPINVHSGHKRYTILSMANPCTSFHFDDHEEIFSETVFYNQRYTNIWSS